MKCISALFPFLCMSTGLSGQVVNPIPEVPGWTLIWHDEFSGQGKPDSTKWSFTGRGKAAWECYCTDNIATAYVRNGKLYLSGILSNDPSDTSEYQTGCISTKGKFSFKYGKMEVRAKLPQGQGTWPAIWMLGNDIDSIGWPGCGEIDILEHLNYDSVFHQTIHSDYIEKLGHKESPPYHQTVPFTEGEFNNFSIEWYPDRIDWFINGRKTFSYPRIPNDSTGVQWPFDNGFYIILDQALGGNWFWLGPVNNNDLPATMIIDWVRIYQQNKRE